MMAQILSEATFASHPSMRPAQRLEASQLRRSSEGGLRCNEADYEILFHHFALRRDHGCAGLCAIFDDRTGPDDRSREKPARARPIPVRYPRLQELPHPWPGGQARLHEER